MCRMISVYIPLIWSSPDMLETKLWRRTDQGSKKVTQTLNNPCSPIKSIIRKCKDYAITTNLPREGHPPKLLDQARRALIREATKRPKMTLKELGSSTAETGVSGHRTTLSCTLQRAGLYGRVAKKKKKIRQRIWSSPEGILETPITHGRRYSGQMWLKLNFLAIKDNAMSGTNLTTVTMLRTLLHSGDVFPRQRLGNWWELKERRMPLNTEKSLRETCLSLPEFWDWDWEVHLSARQWH